jgi:uncharacterized protein (TIGR00251 family)
LIDLESHADGIVLPVRAQPGGRTNAVRGEHDGALRVSVTQVAEKGKANKAVAAVLARQLRLKRTQIELISGQTAPRKRFLIRGVPVETLRDRIESLLADLAQPR